MKIPIVLNCYENGFGWRTSGGGVEEELRTSGG